jgi:hypothetical protein
MSAVSGLGVFRVFGGLFGVRVFRGVVVCVLLCVVWLLVVGVGCAFAGSVWWGLTSGSWPGSLPAGGDGVVVVTAQNRGYADADGGLAPMVVRDVLPVGLKLVVVRGVAQVEGVAGEKTVEAHVFNGAVKCSGVGQEAVCVFEKGSKVGEEGLIRPFEQLEMRVQVEVGEDASSGEVNAVSVSGGGAVGSASMTRGIKIGESSGFGVEDYEALLEEEGGVPSTQAGAHPFQFTTVLGFNVGSLAAKVEEQEPAALVKDVSVELPPGFVGNPTAIPQCTEAQFTTQGKEGFTNSCPPQTAVGTVTATADEPGGGGFQTLTVPLFNLVPGVGEPARFGFNFLGPTTLDTSVRTGSDYGVNVKISNITEGAGVFVSKVTLWGVPGSPLHDSSRGWACLRGAPSCKPLEETLPPPFLSLPTACTGPMFTSVQVDSWAEPEPVDPFSSSLSSTYEIGGLDGCNHLQFSPEVNVTPDVSEASSPSGVTVGIHIPQEAVLNGKGIAESTLKDLALVLPEGLAVNPSGADGLEACSESQIGYLPGRGTFGEPLFTDLEQACPNASKVGELEIHTPLLPNPLKGFVYLATPAPFGEPGMNPFDSLLALYVVAKDPVSGTLVKLPLNVTLNKNTGQLVSTSENIPDLPFETLRLHMFGEERAPLGTPSLCGEYTSVAFLNPWSGEEPIADFSNFHIGTGPDKKGCPNPHGEQSLGVLPFNPSLTGGTTSIQAGGFSPFSTTMSREDGEQDLKAVQLKMPPGLSGVLTGVTLCGEPQADQGTCPESSEIGETTVSVGLGNSPYTVTGGKVFLTGPYEGAPFGLSIVNPANAGPFHLGSVIVRAKIEVNPHTAELTITSDSTGLYKIPTIFHGIPLQIKHVNVTVNRKGFTFNPTNCNKLGITGSLVSSQEAISSISIPFQVTNCAVLAFKPTLTASTNGKTSRKEGASLKVKLTYPDAAQGTQANIASVKVDLPKQLPSQLKTLQKACPAAKFEADPASCPAASIVGHAKAVTPIIPVALEGPAYFVSHGGEAFPSLIVVLQGYGVTVDLVGTTFINTKTNVTSSTFKTVPDVPVGTFEITLPQGPYSALAANGNLCKTKLGMPTAFTAQNNATIHQTTPITVTNCPKTKNKKKKKTKKTGQNKTKKHKK